jgi:hypothetical protein
VARERDELGRFVAAADEAADRLKGFAREVEDSTKASSEHARAAKEEAEEAKQRRQMIGGMALAGLAAAGPGIGVAQATGDFGDGLNASIYGAVSAIGKIPGIGNILGATQAGNVLDRAGGSVSGVTGDLARYGIEVSDEFRSGLVNTAVEQERRVENENQAVMAALGDPGVIGKAGAKGTVVSAAGTFAEDIRSLVEIAKEIKDKLGSIFGGGSS